MKSEEGKERKVRWGLGLRIKVEGCGARRWADGT